MISRNQMGNAHSHYVQSVRQARIHDVWRRLTGERTDLAKLDDVAKHVHARPSPVNRLEYVPLAQIVGSAGRPRDFTRDFLPRPRVNSERWASLDAAVNAGIDLPLVELFRIGDVYFVNDGHHRISVAHANGFEGIEASVTLMNSPVWLTAADFQKDEWQAKAESTEEGLMILLDQEPAQEHIADMGSEVEQARLADVVTAGQPRFQERLRTRLGDALIELGNRVKAPASSCCLLPEGEKLYG